MRSRINTLATLPSSFVRTVYGGGFRKTVLVVVIVAFGSACHAAEEKKSDFDVHIVVPDDVNLPKAHVLIYRVPDTSDDWPKVQADVARNTESEVKASLPAGQYVAEIGALHDNLLTLLRSPPFPVPRTTRITLRAETHSCGATISGNSARVQQVALRRFGNGEVRWSAGDSPPPVLITSPRQHYVASCVADLDQKYLAVWTPSNVIGAGKLDFSDDDAPNHLSFSLREGTPVLSDSQVTLHFPATEFKVDDPTHAVVLTNRDGVYFNYELETDAGETLYFKGGACRISRRPELELGGPLTPMLFAGFIWSESGSTWGAGPLRTRLNLVDADGRLCDLGRSRFAYRADLFLAPDQQEPVPLKKNKVGWYGFKADSVLGRVHYNYGGHTITAECRGEPLVRVHSEHFSIDTPPAWMFRARQFLSCLEAVRRLTISNTGRRGPASFKVEWRSNGDNAKSIVGSWSGGQHDIWMSFPWWTFESFWDPFHEPWFGNHDPYVCHEMLHTWGYQHGGEMSRLEWRAENQYRTFLWRAVDTGIWPVGQVPLRGERQ